MTESKKKYWLKLNKDFLKSPQIKVIKGMQNGKDYIIFYLALMLESVETVGHLRFTSFVPYNAEMLASVTDTNVDIVRSATKIFCELGLMQIFDDGTIFMPQVPEMTGKECDSAERVRAFRKRQAQAEMLPCNSDVTNCNPNIDIDKDIDKDKKIDIYCNNDFEKCFNLYSNICTKLLPLNYERRSKAILELLSNFLDEIEFNFDYFSDLCKTANKLEKIMDTKIDFKMLLNNHIGIMNGKYNKNESIDIDKYFEE